MGVFIRLSPVTMIGLRDSPLERDGFETSVPGERAYGLNLCLSPYELPFSARSCSAWRALTKWLALAGLPRVLAESDADPGCRSAWQY
jgi:hypothetical protein